MSLYSDAAGVGAEANLVAAAVGAHTNPGGGKRLGEAVAFETIGFDGLGGDGGEGRGGGGGGVCGGGG